MTEIITPPRELIEQWSSEKCYEDRDWFYEIHIATRAAQWGADQELEACVEWLQDPDLNVDTYKLRAARRPQPPSLKKHLLQKLDHISDVADKYQKTQDAIDDLRRALEQLDDD